MNSPKSNDDLVFNPRTLRLIIGALAFAFPITVIALTGKITTSISASYYEDANRDVFVGFLFIMGALLIAYKGHLHGDPKSHGETALHWLFSFKWFKVYQEEIISTFGGLAAIFTAIFPTACDNCTVTTEARIHAIGACIMFAAVVYFTLFAFLRSVNIKLVEDNPAFEQVADRYTNRLFGSISIFRGIIKKVRKDFDDKSGIQVNRALQNNGDEINPQSLFARLLAEARTNKLLFLWFAYERKISRGIVYLICGPAITITLILFLYISWTRPDLVANSTITFKVETIALLFFGIAWMTASKLGYVKQILSWLPGGSRKTSSESLANAA